MSCKKLLFLLFLSLNFSVFAITIDDFEGNQQADAGGLFDNGSSSLVVPIDPVTNRTTAIGGSRDIGVAGFVGSTFIRTRVATGLGFLSHSQDSGASGITELSWDGNNKASVFNTSGLGSIDLTHDGSDSIQIDVLSFDSPFNQPLSLEVQVFGAGNKASSSSLVLSTDISSLTSFVLPFSAFTKTSVASAPVDFTKVGAIKLLINGISQDIDLRLEWIGTNSTCRLTPDVNGQVLDECGVCGGDNSSCADCLGVPNGPAVPGTTCDNGLLGVCNGGTYNTSCGCVSNQNPSPELCDGLDNDCDGDVDENFTQLGGTCAMGTAPCDFNGTYICDGSGGVKCDVPNLTNLVNACNSSKGCDGVPNSGLVDDVCGVCGGDGSSCADCQGNPFGVASVDRCGACEGDGLSCLNCNSFDQSKTLRQLDGGAKAQERLLIKVIRQLEVRARDAKTQQYIKRVLNKGHKLMIENWTLSWTLPRVTTTCANKLFCVETSNLDILDTYRSKSKLLREITLKAIRRLLATQGNVHNSMTNNFEKGANRLHDKNMKLADTVPSYQSACS